MVANYWLGIMAVAFAAALALWIVLVFRADRHKPGPARESEPHRDVIGGAFAAREGGRQVMPDPGAPIVPEPRRDVPRQSAAASGQVSGRAVAGQRSRATEPAGQQDGGRRT